jgi:Tol biopolymer transport system component
VTLAGSADNPGFAPGDHGKLDGTPGAGQPAIAYPLDGALFPVNLAPVEVHIQKSDPSQILARVQLSAGALLNFDFYAVCQPSPNPGTFANACIVPINASFLPQLVGASDAQDVSVTARLAAPDGSQLAESAPVAVGWTRTALSGGLYYWTTAGNGDTTFNTAVARYDFNGDASKPSIYLSSDQAPAVPAGQSQCIGCHAISPDGHKLAFSMSGSVPGFFSLFDVATRAPLVTNFNQKFVNMTTFNADGSLMVDMAYGKLTLRSADAMLNLLKDNLFASDVNELISHPSWSHSGKQFAFVSWIPGQYGALNDGVHITGDMVQGAQIWIADSDGQMTFSTPRLLVPRGIGAGGGSGYSYYYPVISDDDNWVAFNRSDCAGPANPLDGWGAGPCDGYNDYSAQLMLISAAGGTPIALARASGDQAWTNSWPRFSPDHGSYRGKTLYWIAYSSRRNYGLALPGSTDGSTKPQLWFTAITVDPSGAPSSDPSYAPVWLPGQDPDLSGPRGNHTPAWTSVAIPII